MGAWVLAVTLCAELITLITCPADASPYSARPTTGFCRGICVWMVAMFDRACTCKRRYLDPYLLLYMGDSILPSVPQ